MIKSGTNRGAFIATVLHMLLVYGCGHPTVHPDKTQPDSVTGKLPAKATDTTSGDSATWANELNSVTNTPDPGTHKPPIDRRQHIVEIGQRPLADKGTDNQKNSTAANDPGDITLNFQDAELKEFIKAVLGDILSENYVLDPRVSGRISLNTSKPLHREELLPLLEQILAMNNASLVRNSGLYEILPRTSATHGKLAPTLGNNTKGYGMHVVPLDYIAATEMQKILQPFMTEGSTLQVDTTRNLLLLSGTSHELNTLKETIELFDVDWLRGMSVGLYPLDHVAAKDLKTELSAVLSAMQTDEKGRPLNGLIRIVPLDRLSSILLIGATPSALREAELWLYRLDKPGETLGRQLYVYRLKNAKATGIADILGQIFSSGSESASLSRPAATAPGLNPVELASPEAGNEILSAQSSARGPAMTERGVTLPSGDTVKIIADDTRNALVVMATPSDYRMVEDAVQRLDVVPLQVLIEASILEVTLTDDLNYGVEWFFKNSVGDKTGQGTLDLGAAGIDALAPAFSYTVIESAGDVRLVLNALSSKTNLDVLSSPSLMVLDNQTAHINVGDEIPVPSRQSISNLDPDAPIVNEIQFRKTGVTLDVKPRVNEGGLVTMEIKQEVSNAVATTSSSIDAPTIQQRSIESVVAVNNGDTIVLGGLIRDSQFKDNRGIPVFHELPLVGRFFGSTANEYARTELLVLLTPRVVKNKQESIEITEEFRRNLRNIQPLEDI